jgi:hypothetical protein
VAVGTGDLHVGGVTAERAQGLVDELLLVRRIERVGVDGDREHGRVDAGQGPLHAAAAPTEVVEVHRPVDHQVGVGVEPAGELGAVVVEVALDVEALPHREAVVQGVELLAAEPLVEHPLGAVADLGRLPGDGEAHVGTVAGRGVVVVAAAPPGVEDDRAALHARERDLLGAGRRGGGDGRHATDPPGVHHAPLEGLHPAHGAPDHGEPAPDAQVVGDRGLGAHDVADRHDRERRAEGRARGRVDRRRAGGALATAEDVDAHHEQAVGVERPTRADERVPPALGRMTGAAAPGGVAVAGQRVAHEHGVRRVGVELTPALVGDGDPAQLTATLEHERTLRGKGEEPPAARGVARPPRPGGGQQVGAQGRPTGRFGHRAPRTLGCPRRTTEAASPPGGGLAPWVSAPGCRTRRTGPLVMWASMLPASAGRGQTSSDSAGPGRRARPTAVSSPRPASTGPDRSPSRVAGP